MNEIFIQEEKTHFRIREWEEAYPGLKVGFTTKNGGMSTSEFRSLNMGFHVYDRPTDVLKNREIVSKQISVNLEQWVAGEQVHDTNVTVVKKKDIGAGSTTDSTTLAGVDGLIIPPHIQGLAIALFADCVPLYFFDPVTKFVGIAHAGWKGTVGKIAAEMVKTFTELGSNQKDIKVAIGPSISGEVYQVDNQVIEHIPETDRKNCIKFVAEGQFLLDLRALNKEILLQSGILRHNIEITKYCTYQDEDLFFSHRRDNGKTGRMLGYIGYNV